MDFLWLLIFNPPHSRCDSVDVSIVMQLPLDGVQSPGSSMKLGG